MITFNEISSNFASYVDKSFIIKTSESISIGSFTLKSSDDSKKVLEFIDEDDKLLEVAPSMDYYFELN